MIIAEEIGRNYHTVDPSPISYRDFVGYDVDVILTTDGHHLLSVEYEGKKMAPIRKYNTEEEADLAARQMIDRHRLSQT